MEKDLSNAMIGGNGNTYIGDPLPTNPWDMPGQSIPGCTTSTLMYYPDDDFQVKKWAYEMAVNRTMNIDDIDTLLKEATKIYNWAKKRKK